MDLTCSKTGEPEDAAGFHNVSLEYNHKYFDLGQYLLSTVLWLRISPQTGFSLDETKLEVAL